jgi:hypothetical protein
MAPAAGAGGDGITAVEVARALNAAQDGGAAAERAAAALWRTASADPDGAFAALAAGADQLVAAAAQTKSPYLERAMRYFSSFAARAPANSEAAAALLEELLARLAGHLSALQRGVRFRAAQLIANILGGLPATLLLEDSVAATLRDALVERLMDKAPAVRAEACHALGHLATDDDEVPCLQGGAPAIATSDLPVFILGQLAHTQLYIHTRSSVTDNCTHLCLHCSLGDMSLTACLRSWQGTRTKTCVLLPSQLCH